MWHRAAKKMSATDTCALTRKFPAALILDRYRPLRIGEVRASPTGRTNERRSKKLGTHQTRQTKQRGENSMQMLSEAQVDAFAIRCTRGPDAIEWTPRYSEAQRNLWRRLIRDLEVQIANALADNTNRDFVLAAHVARQGNGGEGSHGAHQ
jgi:hypothetical protein